MQGHIPDHERLFDEICFKLQELSSTDTQTSATSHIDIRSEKQEEKLEAMQHQLKTSQEDLKQAQKEIEEKIKSLQSLSFTNNDLSREMNRVSEQLENERMANSKLSTDLAKSLELNLKLQFEIEEIRSKAALLLNEEKKLTALLAEKNKNLNNELDLSQALCNETRLELTKAKERFTQDQSSWQKEKQSFEEKIAQNERELSEKTSQFEGLQIDIEYKDKEIAELTESINEFESHIKTQNEMMKSLSDIAEKKLIELKMSLDKKTIEAQDYYGHLQQALTQINVLRQENAALKDYIAKLSTLHQQNSHRA